VSRVPRHGSRPSSRLARWALLGLLAITPGTTAPAGAETVSLLEGPWEAAVERARLVLEARQSVDVAAFIVGSEPFSLTSMALLRDAARRGVHVRLLVDAQWNKLPRAVEAHLTSSGVAVRHYHPFRWGRLSWVTRRLHDKLLVVDGASLITGGRNVESPYFGLGRQLRRRDYLDLDVLVVGDVAGEAAGYFERLWSSRHVHPSDARASAREQAAAADLLDRHFAWLAARIDGERHAERTRPPIALPVAEAHFLFDPPGHKGKAPGVAEGLLTLLEQARHHVVIESPYLVPTRGLRAGLERALDRGVAVRILTNSLASTDNLWPQAGYVGERRWLVEHGVELWELLGPASLHAKAAVIDGEVAVVGSFNLDPRSQRLNTEVAVVLPDRAVAGELLAIMDERLTNAVRIGRDGRPIGFARRYPNASTCRVWQLRFARLLAPLIRSQL
jgi:putative cardiolipin synthase